MYNPSYENFGAPQGWRCPICGRVYSPTTPMCFYCSNKENTIQTDINISNEKWWEKYQLTSHQIHQFKDESTSWRNYLDEKSIWEELL